VQKILAREGRTFDGTGERDAEEARPAEQLALSACYGAAASGLGLDGDRAGQPLLRIVEPSLARQAPVRAREAVEGRHRRALARALDLIARVCALVPPPRQHMVGYPRPLRRQRRRRAPQKAVGLAPPPRLRGGRHHVPSLLGSDALDRGRRVGVAA
jgi:hypothetical protein